MKGRIVKLFAFFCWAFSSAFGQNWQDGGKFGQTGPSGGSGFFPDLVWFDSTEQKLLIAGNHFWYDSIFDGGIAYLVSDSVIPIGCGLEINCGTGQPIRYPRVYGAARYNGDLFITGSFFVAGGQVVNHIAKFGVNDWEPIGTGLSSNNGFGDGIGYGLEVINGE